MREFKSWFFFTFGTCAIVLAIVFWPDGIRDQHKAVEAKCHAAGGIPISTQSEYICFSKDAVIDLD